MQKVRIICIMLFFSSLIFAQKKSQLGIGFMQLKIESREIEVDSVWAVSGKLKLQKKVSIPNSQYYYQICSNDDILFTQKAENPFENVFEYPDANGNLTHFKHNLDSKIISLRFPLFSQNTSLQILKRSRNAPDTVIWEKT